MKEEKRIDIIIAGPTQTGKTIISHRIAELLREEFNANVVESADMQEDPAGSSGYELAQWERELVGRSTWIIREQNTFKGEEDFETD